MTPNGYPLQIPLWMTMTIAETIQLSSEVIISAKALLKLGNLLGEK